MVQTDLSHRTSDEFEPWLPCCWVTTNIGQVVHTRVQRLSPSSITWYRRKSWSVNRHTRQST